jgi:hypothetical protein
MAGEDLTSRLGCVAQQVSLGDSQGNPQTPRIDHDAGASMTTTETVIFWLAVFWAPGLVFVGYLLLPRRSERLIRSDASHTMR